jgi:hypothetical protein
MCWQNLAAGRIAAVASSPPARSPSSPNLIFARPRSQCPRRSLLA